jgi:hypothetical protein
MNNELEGKREHNVVACFEVISSHLSRYELGIILCCLLLQHIPSNVGMESNTMNGIWKESILVR